MQYRGVNGNPDNCISFKMRLADPAFQLEADGGDRAKRVFALDPSHFYFFRAMWNDGFRMIIQNSVGAGTFYDLEYKSTDQFHQSGSSLTSRPPTSRTSAGTTSGRARKTAASLAKLSETCSSATGRGRPRSAAPLRAE